MLPHRRHLYQSVCPLQLLGVRKAEQMNYEEKTEQTPLTPEIEAAVRRTVLDRASTELEQFAAAAGDTNAFAHLPTAAAAAYHLGRFADARQFAERALALAPQFAKNWNYGNAIHLGHTVLGLLALDAQDHESAVAELRLSAQTPGSPQLSSFGPTMHLAKELLKIGQIEPVLAYLGQCRAFWEMGSVWLDLWERKVREGKVPNFFQHSYA